MLLNKKKNKRGQHVSPLFKDKQSKCLSAERFGESHYAKPCGIHTIVNFTKGEIDETATNIGFPYCQSVYYCIRAVRSIK